MNTSTAIGLLIILALITANLPFVAQRPFLVLPWAAPGGRTVAGATRWLESIVFFAVLAVLGYVTWSWVASSLATGFAVLLRVVVMGVLFAACLAYPGYAARGKPTVVKPVFQRLVEVLVFYVLVGLMAFALEASIGNVFVQGWEFYVITFSLFLVFAYPGFVWRYLMRHRQG